MTNKIILPIYFTQEFKTKDPKTFLVGMNWFRNAFHHQQNLVKSHYHSIVSEQLTNSSLRIEGQYTLSIKLYYKNTSCDGSNIFAMMEKFTLDALQSLEVTKQDNVKFHIGTTTTVIEQDKLNPRVEIEIIEVNNEQSK